MRARASLSKARKPVRVSAERHNEVLAAAQARVDALEGRLARVVEGVIDRAGARAAHRFALKATNHLTAAAGNANVSASATMICLRPRPDETEAIADPDGDAPETLHVTLAYLGKTDQPLAEIAEALQPVAASLAPLEGAVGGYGVFDPPGVGILLPDVRGLVELRVAVTEALLEARIDYGRQHGFEAHLTVTGDPSWAARNVDEGNHAEDDARGAGTSATAGGADCRGVPNLRPESVEATFRPGQGQRSDDLRASARLDLPAGAARPDAASASSLRERALPERRAYGAADQLAAREGDESEARALLGSWDEVRETELARTRGLPEMLAGSDSEASSAETGGAYPASACGLPLHFDAIHVVRGNDEEVVIPLVGVPSLTAAGEPPAWSAPFPDEVIDIDKLVAELLAKTDPVRKAMIEQTMTAALEQAGLSWDVTNPLTAKVLAQSASQIRSIAETTQLNVMRIIKSAYQNGLTIPQTATAIRAGMKVASSTRATLIARTELAGAANGGSLAATQLVAGATGQNYSKSWRTAPGAKYPRHEDYDGLDGQTVVLDGTFQVGEDQLRFPGDPDGDPGEVCNCFPAETLVEMPSLRAAMRRWYEGDLVRVRLASGDELAATPNHPVLRADGQWVPLREIEEGDHLVRALLAWDDSGAPDPERPPSEIGETYRLTSIASDPERVRLRPPDLHGDGADGEIEVVALDGDLLLDLDAASDEEIAEFGLALASAARTRTSRRDGALAVFDGRGRYFAWDAACGVSPLSEDSALIKVEPLHPDLVRVGASPNRKSELLKAPDDGGTTDFERPTNRQDAISALVTLAEVIQVEVEPFHGYVYNLDTGKGWYTAGTIACRNCRCTITYGPPVVEDEAAARSPVLDSATDVLAELGVTDATGATAEMPEPVRTVAEIVPGAPEMTLESVDRTISSRVGAYAQKHNMTEDEYREASLDSIKRGVADAQVGIRIAAERLESFLNDGRYKTQFETGTSGGLLSTTLRADAEEQMFGYKVDLDPGLRPVYGYLLGSADETGPISKGYGDILLKLKPETNARTTFSLSDSLGMGRAGGLAPSSLLDPTLGSWSIGVDPVEADGVLRKLASGEYAEAQIHGGVNVSDIEEVLFSAEREQEAIEATEYRARIAEEAVAQGRGDAMFAAELRARANATAARGSELRAQLDALGIAWRLLPSFADFVS